MPVRWTPRRPASSASRLWRSRTKTSPFMNDALKAYRFTVRLGQATNTDDAEGEVIETSDLRPTDDAIRAALPAFRGDILQVPPQFSAVKVDGQRAYKLARDGDEVELAGAPAVNGICWTWWSGPIRITRSRTWSAARVAMRLIARDLGADAWAVIGHVCGAAPGLVWVRSRPRDGVVVWSCRTRWQKSAGAGSVYLSAAGNLDLADLPWNCAAPPRCAARSAQRQSGAGPPAVRARSNTATRPGPRSTGGRWRSASTAPANCIRAGCSRRADDALGPSGQATGRCTGLRHDD